MGSRYSTQGTVTLFHALPKVRANHFRTFRVSVRVADYATDGYSPDTLYVNPTSCMPIVDVGPGRLGFPSLLFVYIGRRGR